MQRKYQITTDMTDTVGQVFLAQSVGCARCHDHKFDKISQKEYFQLQAFFANTSEVNDIPADKGPQEIAFEQRGPSTGTRSRSIRDQQKADHRPDPRGRGQISQGALPHGQPVVAVQARECSGRALDRWVNHRLANVSQESDYFAISATSARTRTIRTTAQENGERV